MIEILIQLIIALSPIMGHDATVTTLGQLAPPCVEEDSTNCYWDAQARGDSNGESFVSIDGRYYYFE